ncbi:MAG: anhydro-N-acetylmuramic acid kinase [bacterium]|nr:anhydro-N-acetylmuramic acid kinase [bacterium]
MDLITRYRSLPKPRVVGIMSGTSADAIDAALVEMGEHPVLINFISLPMPERVRQRLQDIFTDHGSPSEITKMHWLLGELFAQAALQVMGEQKADLIASHGQTVCHLPYGEEYLGFQVRGTLQIGEAALIAERTGCLTVGDFRPQDLAAGGQGAPLVPYADYLLFHDGRSDRIALNIGGMANITVIPAKGDIIACDTGPGNALSDALMYLTAGSYYDKDGAVAAQGKVIPELLADLMHHPYLALPAPKSTGREEFGRELAASMLPRGTASDLVRTALAFTAKSIARHAERYTAGKVEMYAAGGGVDNPVLWQELLSALPSRIKLHRLEELGIPAQARECVAFALLGHEALGGRPANVPAATGASRRVILGKIVQP